MSVREITKALAGQEDILFGQGTTNQTRNGTVYPITRIDKIHPVTTRAALKTLVVTNANLYFRTAMLLGLDVIGAGGGLFCHSATVLKSIADDIDIIIDSNSASTTGCWVRIIPNSVSGLALDYTEIGAWLASTLAETVVATELVVNGHFTTDTSGWAPQQNALLAAIAGELRVTANGVGYPAGSRSFTTVVGRRYVVTGTARRGTCVGPARISVPTIAGAMQETTSTSNVPLAMDFIATATSHEVNAEIYAPAPAIGETAFFDDISCVIGDEDLSITDQALRYHGTITKSAVNTDANLMAYSGFTIDNYLSRAYGIDLNITTQLTIMAWVNGSTVQTVGLCGNYNDTSGDIGGYMLWLNDGSPSFGVVNNAGVAFTVSESGLLPATGWTFLAGTVTAAGLLSLYRNGVLVNTVAGVTIGDTVTTFKVGLRTQGGTPVEPYPGKISAVKPLGRALTAEEIKDRYDREKAQFIYS